MSRREGEVFSGESWNILNYRRRKSETRDNRRGKAENEGRKDNDREDNSAA